MIRFLSLMLIVSSSFADMPEADEPFTTDIACEFTCTGSPQTQKATFARTFSPLDRELRRGNGNYWGVLGYNLWTWGREWCLEKAVRECSPKVAAESAVADFSLLSLTSDKWTVAEPIDCRKRDHNIPSPYWSGSSTELRESALAGNAGRTTTLAAAAMPAKGAKETCEHPISGEMCYGDCLVPLKGVEFTAGDGGMETLASASPNAEQAITYCADTFVKEFGGKDLSKPVLQHYCEAYVWNRVVAKNRNAAFCAATRISTKCDQLVALMLSNAGAKAP